MASDLCGGGPSPSPRMWQGGPGAQFEQAGGKLHEVGSHGCSDENGEDKEHKGKKTIQRRRRRKP